MITIVELELKEGTTNADGGLGREPLMLFLGDLP